MVSSSCLEDALNKILKHQTQGRTGKPDTPNTTPSTPAITPSTPPKPVEPKKPSKNVNEIVYSYDNLYNTKASLDYHPAVFNDTGTFLTNYNPEFKHGNNTLIFKHPTAMFYYSGIKKYYDYILQVDNIKDKEGIKNRIKKLLTESKPEQEKINNGYSTERLGKIWYDAITYDLNKIIAVFADFYKQDTQYAKMYHGVLPLDYENNETILKTPHDDGNWYQYQDEHLDDSIKGEAFLSYIDMFKVSKNFYERTDRHFLQERVKLNSDNILHLDPVPNLNVPNLNKSQNDYVDKWYNTQFEYYGQAQDDSDFIGVYPKNYYEWLPSDKRLWEPQLFYNSPLILAPFKPIQNSNIKSKHLIVLKHYIQFKQILTLLSQRPLKSFLELLDDKENKELQQFYKINKYNQGFKSFISSFNDALYGAIDPTIYLNYIDENGVKRFFYDEWEESLSYGRKGHVQPSNQRQMYIFALNLYNKLIMPFNYILNKTEGLWETGIAKYDQNVIFKQKFYEQFYKPEFGSIAKYTNTDAVSKTKTAKKDIAKFLQTSNFVDDKPIKNLLGLYEISSKDITDNQFNDLWLNPKVVK
ncbi:hypothetical protein KQ874_02990 [Mycoplasma sp. ES3157-GEN-MYC]|uniref:hypothetical protein n=1 Tax=Mycoplasma miroungigenitalium TaxID=754515 RepID=UPI001C112B5C|nr:hypothetical protein [Mycoplasma miroungigenitalium]MBU4690643.1 hypothetical protein [Mycoplasma miroungigenitalium]MBU4691911.1 hypothetical protein [Mycoplasma miroungigenitalium]